MRSALRRHRFPPSALVLEITETTIIRDFEGCKEVIDELRDLGLAVSIDDFGSGFTSLAYLGQPGGAASSSSTAPSSAA